MTLYDFEKCEAAFADGRRCQHRATEYVRNPGAPFPYAVCGIHARQGERSVARSGELPEVWSNFWKRWAA